MVPDRIGICLLSVSFFVCRTRGNDGVQGKAQPVKSLRPTASDVGALLEFSATVSDSASIETSKTEFKLRMPREPPPNYTLSMANNLQPFQRERSIMASLSVATVQLQEIKWKI
ncbi:hypothetical protein RUM44_010344 [Polyplax serrata]|uniref:Uncharacterized protein n=1 Tax=Polyplax serrata TaxID=468196 RepID=A0ABR1AV98_POLSC